MVTTTGGAVGAGDGLNFAFDELMPGGRTRADLTNSCGATNPLSEAGRWPLPKQLKVEAPVVHHFRGLN